jgi:hypothetical protein
MVQGKRSGSWMPVSLLLIAIIGYVSNTADANRVQSTQGFQVYNAEIHRTNRFRDMIADRTSPKVVVRRGQEFFFGLRMTENFNQQATRLQLRMLFGMKNSNCDRVNTINVNRIHLVLITLKVINRTPRLVR